MTLSEKKREMIAYRDYYGYDIMYTDEINAAKSDKELAQIISKYSTHIELMANDAQSHLESFKRRIGVSLY